MMIITIIQSDMEREREREREREYKSRIKDIYSSSVNTGKLNHGHEAK